MPDAAPTADGGGRQNDYFERHFLDVPDVPPTPSGLVSRLASKVMARMDRDVRRAINVLWATGLASEPVDFEARSLATRMYLMVWASVAVALLLALALVSWIAGNGIGRWIWVLWAAAAAEVLLWFVRYTAVELRRRGSASTDHELFVSRAWIEWLVITTGLVAGFVLATRSA